MTRQLDTIPLPLVDDPWLPLEAVMSSRAIADLKQRILDQASRLDVGHELVLPERARSDHR